MGRETMAHDNGILPNPQSAPIYDNVAAVLLVQSGLNISFASLPAQMRSTNPLSQETLIPPRALDFEATQQEIHGPHLRSYTPRDVLNP